MRYRRAHLLLDLFGLIGVLLAVSYYVIGHQTPENQKDQELGSLWANISTDILGIWLGVRLIDYIIERRAKEDRARLSTVRNLRYLMGQLRRAIEFAGRHEIATLKTEVEWGSEIFKKRIKYFSADEIRDMDAFFTQMRMAFPLLEKLSQLRAASYSGQQSREAYEKETETAWASLAAFEAAFRTAERNILEETQEE